MILMLKKSSFKFIFSHSSLISFYLISSGSSGAVLEQFRSSSGAVLEHLGYAANIAVI